MYKILLIDDDNEVLAINKKFFEKNNCEVAICSDARKGLALVKSFAPDCILLDVMMPEVNGYLLCKQIRQFSNVPILFLSGNVSEDDKIKGFQCGADDYIEKPYSLKEVYIRVIANIKRSHAIGAAATAAGTKKASVIDIPPLHIELESRKVTDDEEEIPLANREYDLLLYMAKRPNELITIEDIGNAIWGAYSEADKKSIMVNVSRLRKKIADYTGRDNLIETVWSKGYKLVVKS